MLHPFLIKILYILHIEGTYFNIIKIMYDKSKVNMFNSKNLKAFSSKNRKKTRMLTLTFIST